MFGTYRVTLDDGSTVEVSADNRDLIALRRRGYRDLGEQNADAIMRHFGEASESTTAAQGLELIEALGWLLWNAGSRAGTWAIDFDAWIEKECVSIELVEQPQPRPTPAASAEPSES